MTAALVVGAGVAPDVDRVVANRRLDEASALAPSARFPGVLWLLEDSGNPAVLSAIDAQGRTAARLTVAGVENRDWEALAALALPDGRPALAVADIGDNDREYDSVQVHVVAEPDRLASGPVDPLVTLDLTYPDGPDNAEALLADPRDGQLYVVTKDLLGGAIYAVPASVWPPAGDPAAGAGVLRAELELVTGVSTPLVTDGTVLPDGRIVLRTYTAVAVYPPVEQLARGTIVGPTASDPLPAQEQGEAVSTGPGGTLLVGSEGQEQPVLRVPVPVSRAPDGPTSEPTNQPTNQPATEQPGALPASTDPVADVAGPARAALVAAAVTAGLLLLVGAWVVGRRR